MKETRAVDVAVMGAGTAGLAAYRAAVKRGKKAVIIEGGVHGTTCARVGCMPSKLLIAAAEAAHEATHARPFGVSATVQVDGKAVMDRVRRERDRFVGFVLEGVESIPKEDLLHGCARFVAPHELDVAGSSVTAQSVVIATGSSPNIPPMFSAIADRLIINDNVFAWDELPESLAVFGAGVIGLEIGQALHRLGVRVRIFGRSGTVGPLTDPVAKDVAAKIFRSELAVDFDASILAVERDGAGVRVRYKDADGAERSEHFGCALIAAGRKPNTSNLGLEHSGIDLDAKIDRYTLQWGDSYVFVAGDASDDIPLLHEAADEGAIAGDNAARFPNVLAGDRRTPLGVAFSDPAIAIIAGGYAAATKHGRFVIGEVDFGNQGRSRIMLKNKGSARLYADPVTHRFLGAELVGPRAEHLAHLLAWAHQAGLTIDQMLAMPFYHPVIEEGIRTALRDVATKLERTNVPMAPADRVRAVAAAATPTK